MRAQNYPDANCFGMQFDLSRSSVLLEQEMNTEHAASCQQYKLAIQCHDSLIA